MGGAVRDVSAALLGASSHTRKPPAQKTGEGVGKEEDLMTAHGSGVYEHVACCQGDRFAGLRIVSGCRTGDRTRGAHGSIPVVAASAAACASFVNAERTGVPDHSEVGMSPSNQSTVAAVSTVRIPAGRAVPP